MDNQYDRIYLVMACVSLAALITAIVFGMLEISHATAHQVQPLTW